MSVGGGATGSGGTAATAVSASAGSDPAGTTTRIGVGVKVGTGVRVGSPRPNTPQPVNNVTAVVTAANLHTAAFVNLCADQETPHKTFPHRIDWESATESPIIQRTVISTHAPMVSHVRSPSK